MDKEFNLKIEDFAEMFVKLDKEEQKQILWLIENFKEITNLSTFISLSDDELKKEVKKAKENEHYIISTILGLTYVKRQAKIPDELLL